MKFVPVAVSRTVARQALLAQKNSPGLLFGAGVLGMVGSTVLACRATLKVEEILAQTQNDLNVARGMEHKDYSEDDRKQDITKIYARGILGITRLYGPAIIVASFSIAALTKSHNILNERNAALTAAYTAIDKAFNKYRERVIEKHGVDEDREFRYGSQEVDIVEEDGKIVTRTRVDDGELPSMYARFFDPLSSQWSKEPEYNMVFLRGIQNWANDMLKARGHLFLNEVYDNLGLERTKAGSVVGWIISKDGDNFVDFGIYDQSQNSIDFVNGREGSILLDFNVDGVIYDKIGFDSGERLAWQQ